MGTAVPASPLPWLSVVIPVFNPGDTLGRTLGSLAIPTLGFPKAVAALTWIEDITDEARPAPPRS